MVALTLADNPFHRADVRHESTNAVTRLIIPLDTVITRKYIHQTLLVPLRITSALKIRT